VLAWVDVEDEVRIHQTLSLAGGSREGVLHSASTLAAIYGPRRKARVSTRRDADSRLRLRLRLRLPFSTVNQHGTRQMRVLSLLVYVGRVPVSTVAARPPGRRHQHHGKLTFGTADPKKAR